jgi:hypothetical protein
MQVTVKKVGGIWHGTVEGTDIDERGLTEEVAGRKAEERLKSVLLKEKRMIHEADFGNCQKCGEKIVYENMSEEEVQAKRKQIHIEGAECDKCKEGITSFEKQVGWRVFQWLGPVENKKVSSVAEPQNASYVVVTLKDGRTAKIHKHGETFRELDEEIGHVFGRDFPELKKSGRKNE